MKINEVEGLVNSGLAPDIVYKKLKEFYKWIKESETIVNPDLLNTHKEILWQEIELLQELLNSAPGLLSSRQLTNLKTIKSKIWIE